MRLDARGLRGRLAAALTLFAVAAVVLLALAFWAGETVLERDSERRLLRHSGDTADRAYHDYNADLARRRGLWLLALLGGATTAAAAIALWLSGRIARHSLRPLAELVAQIEDLDLERRHQRVTLASPDPELQVIVAALNTQLAELDTLIERERAFAAAASHELRTPLTVIGGAASVLGQLPQVPAGVLARIERAVAQARQNLDALLALSRGRDAAPAAPQRLDRLLQDIAAVHLDAHANPDTRVHWDLPGPVELAVAAGPLSIIFGNLLANALRAAAGGEIRIHVDATGIRVTDNGPGLPPELLRADALAAPAARRDGGSGLGLYIASTLARREGWRLTLRPGDAGGACAELHFQG
jgi:signal transduction histidine kinase